MLVLSRKKNETILIDGNVEIEVLQIKGNTIRLGIKAPKDIRVLRGELKPFGLSDQNATQDCESGIQNFDDRFTTEIQTISAKAG